MAKELRFVQDIEPETVFRCGGNTMLVGKVEPNRQGDIVVTSHMVSDLSWREIIMIFPHNTAFVVYTPQKH